MSLRLITPPTNAITLQAVKDNLSVQHDEHDELLYGMVTAACAYFERDAGRAFGPQTWEETFDAFPATRLALSRGPVASVVSVTYRDSLGAWVVMPATGYLLEEGSEPLGLLPVGSWPVAQSQAGSVVVRYVAGFGWPEEAKQAIHLLVGNWYANREATSTDAAHEVPFGVHALMGLHRRMYA